MYGSKQPDLMTFIYSEQLYVSLFIFIRSKDSFGYLVMCMKLVQKGLPNLPLKESPKKIMKSSKAIFN